MASITPFVKRMRVQGGTLYTFSSANEDIGLNINERNVVVKMSHYVMLNVPELKTQKPIEENTFNVFGPSGALGSFSDSGSIKDGRVIVAESFQNYALNFETNLLSRPEYNPSLLTTVSERVFWKWMKETGAIRWDYDSSGYWTEEQRVKDLSDYNPVVMGWGEISGGAVRSNTFGTFNETYVLVPTSYGQGAVYWRQVEDSNYFHGLSIVDGAENIKGRENWLKPHPDGLEILAYYDIDASSFETGNLSPYSMEYKYPTTSSYVDGWWTDAQSIPFVVRSYYVDTSSYIASGDFNIDLKYTGPGTIEFRRSLVDCLSVEFNINRLRTFLGDPLLTVDSISIQDALDDDYDFNAVLLYYSVYNEALDKTLATNLLGILFLDTAAGAVSAAETMEITIPSITKLQSGPSGFGTSYSFRVNIKSDSMLDDTQAVIVDESSSVTMQLENFTEVFDQLSKSLSILNQHTGTINFITNQYTDIQGTLTQTINELISLEQTVNTISRDIVGTENVIPMYIAGDDPLGDSSIYMQGGNVGIKTATPSYPLEVSGDTKVMDLYIENAVRDTSGNVLLGYGSPLQLGASTNEREVYVYVGETFPLTRFEKGIGVTIDGNLTVTGDVSFGNDLLLGNELRVTGGTFLGSNLSVEGNLTVTGDVSFGGSVEIPGFDLVPYVKESSLGTTFIWAGGILDVSGGGGGVSQAYVDGSLATRDASIVRIDASLNDVVELLDLTHSQDYIDGSLAARDASIDYLIENDAWIKSGTAIYYNDGSVGIGTATPNYKLSIEGNSILHGMGLGRTDGILMYHSGGGNYIIDSSGTGGFSLKSSGGQLTLVSGPSSDDMIFQTGDTTGTRMTIKGGAGTDLGFVGLGTTGPTVRLTVVGDASISGSLRSNSLTIGTNIIMGSTTAINGSRQTNLRSSSITVTSTISIEDSTDASYNDKFIIIDNSTLDVSIYISGNLPSGFQCTLFKKGTGEVIIDQSTGFGTSIYSEGNKRRINGQYAAASIIKPGSGAEIMLMGNLTT